MTKRFQKLKSFTVGLWMAGMAAIAATSIPGSQGSCAGTCAQCGVCGLTALPLVLWLWSKRWQPLAKILVLFDRPIVRAKRIRAIEYPQRKS